jgi:PAS domain S-box-containing protein
VATRMFSSISGPPGYVLVPLREAADFILYRGRQHGDPSPILAVAPATKHPSPQSLRRLEHEYLLASELDPAWAAKPLALTRHEGRTLLVLKDPGGEPLDLVLERGRGQPLDLTRFLRIAIGLAAALGQVHRRSLLHKDIKPANVLVDDAGKVWLTGFGIASQVPRERQAPVPPEIIAGTLAYMAPEQTGRMNRSTDARSDLYSVGVTLYEIFTGALPFAANDPLGWVHCHIARQPTPPGNRGAVPDPLSAILMKLLAKNPEERYQTASGLEADLRRCLEEWQSHGRIDPFPLGAHDSSDRLLIPEKLYGREREIDVLLAAFDRVVAQGTPELVLVSGYSGVGKSSVVNELHKALVPPRGLFASGKFDQYGRDIPYATLAQAFQTLVRQILVKSEAEVERWRGAIQEALGANGQLIGNLIPELEFIIGKQPSVPDLPPQDARNRFKLVFRRFLGVFARPEHPLALFLDDLQWLDGATLELLEHLTTDPDLRHLMLVGAYRDNEVSSSHPLTRTLDAIRKAGGRMQEIALSPLGLDDVGRLAADALHCEGNSGHPLAQLVHEKSGGNPFFAIQFLTALAEEGLLRFDPDAAAWIWDVEQIRAKGYTDNVADLMVGKLKRLSNTTQDALKRLACLGNEVEIATLSLVFEESEEQINTSLLEAARTGLILRLEGSYAFFHDRVQEAAYALIPEGDRVAAHLRIGRVLLASMTADGLAEHLFDVANQFNRGAALLIDRDEKARVATIDLRAGRKAKASVAYASAGSYFSAGMELLDERDWNTQYELTFSLWLERAECEFLSGNVDTAEQLIGELLQRGASNIDQAAAYRLKVQLHMVRGEYPKAVDDALTCLRLLGIDLLAHPTREQVQAEYDTVWQNLNGRPIESLIDLPLLTDPEVQAAMQVLATLSSPAFFTDFQLFCLHLCRMVNVTLRHGICGASAPGCGFFGFILGSVFHRHSEGYRFAKLSCDLVEKLGSIAYQARVHLTMGTIAFWTQPVASAIEFNRAAFRSATETGDLTFACYGRNQFVAGLLLRNDPLDALWRETEKGLDFAQKARFRDAADVILSQQRFIATMQGRTATFSTFSDAQFDEATFEAQLAGDRLPMLICWYWILKLKARFLSGDYAEALAAADKAKLLLSTAPGSIQLLDYFYYAALTVAALYENASTDEQTGWRDLLTAHRGQLREWAENYPPTFADKHTLVLAEIARLEKRDADAMQLYEQAIHLARDHGFVQNEGLANELTAQYYLAHGLETAGYAYLRNARNCYDRWGALGKLKQLDERYPHLQEERVLTSNTATIGAPVGQLDAATVVKASQAISSEIVLSNLIEKLMRIAVEHAGAERGLLILLRGDEPRIEADAATGHGRVEVTVRQTAITQDELPQSALQYVIRTRERVVLDDASTANLYSEDEYVRTKRARSVLCLPIVKQTKLIGALYLENNLAPRAFTSDRVAVLEMLASQAAISFENTKLYSDLHRNETFLAQGQSISHTGSFGWSVFSGDIYWSEETYTIFEYDRALKPTLELIFQRVHPDDRDLVQQTIDRVTRNKTDFDLEHRLLMQDGSVKHLHVVARALEPSTGKLEFVGAVTDITATKQAEEKIRESEMELRQVLELAPQLVSIVMPDRDRLYTNQTTLDYCGCTLEEWRSGDRLRFFHPDDWERVTSVSQSLFPRGLAHEYEARLRRKDGQYRWTLFRWRPIRDEQGQLLRWYVVGTDIEDRKRAEALLNAEKGLLELMAKGGPLTEILDNLCRLVEEHAGGVLASISLLEGNRLRHGSAPSLPKAYTDAIDGAEIGPSAGSCGTAAYLREQVIVEDIATDPLWADYRELALTHGLRACWSTPIITSQGKVLATLAAYCREPRKPNGRDQDIIEQITDLGGVAIERKLAQDALQRSEAYLAEAQRLSHTGSWTYNPAKHKPDYWSAEMFRICGFDPQQGPPTGDAFLERVPSEDRERVHVVFYNAMQEKTEYEDEHRIIFPDGTIRHIHSVGHPVLNRSGNVVEFVGSAVDVTERKRAEEERERLHQLEADLARLNRVSMMGELAASLAHEIKQPISAASLDAGTCSEWLAHNEPNIEEARQAASRIIHDVTRAAEIIDRVRSLFRKGELHRESLDVNEIIREMIGLLCSEAGRKSVSIRTELADSLPLVWADRVQLQQIFMNLALNAIDAIKESNTPGTLTIKSQLDSDGVLLISVSDTGVGLPRDQMDKIFDAFFTTKSQGTGMGLSISRSIVESHGGHLWATANSERGATFHFTFPADVKAA